MGEQLDAYVIKPDNRANYSQIKTPKGRKETEMSNQVQTTGPKPDKKKYNKTRGEHFKDIVIAVLITAVIAFVSGASYANKQNAEIDAAVDAVEKTVNTQAPVKK